MNDYLESVREIERRIQVAGKEQQAALDLPPAPVGIPFNFEEHIKLMYDLMALAYQANITRVFTYMVAREESNKTYPQVDVHDGHHATSHHQNRAGEDREAGQDPDVPHRPVRRVPARS